MPEPFRAAFASLRREQTAIDCGARGGAITETMAVSGARVFAFEPDPEAFEKLRWLERFPNVTLLESAVSDHAGREPFYLAGESSSLFHERNEYWDGSPPVEVEVIDLAAFIAELGQVHLLKMDIEGAEVPVLRQLLETRTIHAARHVFVEMHERMIPPELAREASRLRDELARCAPHVHLDWP
ncbi:MAG: FkbM family methyltransferase [Gaiellaceae bacterium]